MDKRAKSCDRLKIRDETVKKLITYGSLAEIIKQKKKNYLNGKRSLNNRNERVYIRKTDLKDKPTK